MKWLNKKYGAHEYEGCSMTVPRVSDLIELSAMLGIMAGPGLSAPTGRVVKVVAVVQPSARRIQAESFSRRFMESIASIWQLPACQPIAFQ